MVRKICMFATAYVEQSVGAYFCEKGQSKWLVHLSRFGLVDSCASMCISLMLKLSRSKVRVLSYKLNTLQKPEAKVDGT